MNHHLVNRCLRATLAANATKQKFLFLEYFSFNVVDKTHYVLLNPQRHDIFVVTLDQIKHKTNLDLIVLDSPIERVFKRVVENTFDDNLKYDQNVSISGELDFIPRNAKYHAFIIEMEKHGDKLSEHHEYMFKIDLPDELRDLTCEQRSGNMYFGENLNSYSKPYELTLTNCIIEGDYILTNCASDTIKRIRQFLGNHAAEQKVKEQDLEKSKLKLELTEKLDSDTLRTMIKLGIVNI